MAKFMVLFKSSGSASELMASASPEEMKASMAEWMSWKDKLDSLIGFEWGMPLQAVADVTSSEIKASQSTVSGYAIMEGAKDSITDILKTHPHLKRDDSSIEVLEMMSMPGM